MRTVGKAHETTDDKFVAVGYLDGQASWIILLIQIGILRQKQVALPQ